MMILVGRYLRARAWWRLDCAGVDARRAARSVVALLDAASYMRDVPDDDPDIATMEWAGCFRSGAFDPGPMGAFVVRGWQLAERTTGGPRELLAALADAATTTPPLPRQEGLPGGVRQGPSAVARAKW